MIHTEFGVLGTAVSMECL